MPKPGSNSQDGQNWNNIVATSKSPLVQAANARAAAKIARDLARAAKSALPFSSHAEERRAGYK